MDKKWINVLNNNLNEEESKFNLLENLGVITKKYNEYISNRVLDCIEKCKDDNLNIHKTIDEISLLLSDDIIIRNLKDNDSSLLYNLLWENYFLLWDFDKAIENYYKSFHLWNTKVYERLISLKIFFKLPYKTKKELDSWDIEFSEILNELDKNQNEYYFGDQMKADLVEFFEWWADFIEKPNTLQWYMYNVEVMEEKWTIELQSLEYVDNQEIGKLIENFKWNLYDSYMEIANAIDEKDYVYLSIENMVKRLNWWDIDYLEYGKELRGFIDVWFEVLEIYNNIWKEEDIYILLDFIIWNWFKNLWNMQKTYIIKKTKSYLENLDSLNEDTINKILLKATYEWSMLYDTMILMWDIFLNIWKYWNSFSFYMTARESWLDVEDKLAELLKTIISNKNFPEDHLTNVEFILSDLIEKSTNNEKFINKDIENIKYLCNL